MALPNSKRRRPFRTKIAVLTALGRFADPRVVGRPTQVHRELASGLSCPVGFKNGTDGNIRIAVDAIKAAASPHHFLSVTKAGHSAIVSTNGNEDCHVILRGGKAPNYDAAAVEAACAELAKSGLASRVMVDFSHANSSKQFKKQIEVAAATVEDAHNKPYVRLVSVSNRPNVTVSPNTDAVSASVSGVGANSGPSGAASTWCTPWPSSCARVITSRALPW